MQTVATMPGCIVMVHAENPHIIARVRRQFIDNDRNDLRAWTESRPDFTEAESVHQILYLSDQTGCPVYFPHVSCKKALDVVADHRVKSTSTVYVETCPQYLTHT